MKHPVCIIMATYNGERFLREQLNSIVAQTYKGWVLYVSDDGSSDNTLKILKEYQRKLGKDKLIITKNTRNKHGAKYNFCYAIDTAPEADYYFFSDQDDYWDEKKIETQLLAIEKMKGPSLVYCDANIVDKDLKLATEMPLSEQFSRIPEKHALEETVFTNRVAGCTMCLKRELLEAAKGLDPDKIIMHDFYIVLYALSFGEIKFIPERLNFYRQHEDNVMGARIDYKETTIPQKIGKFFSKKYHQKWHEDVQEYIDQAEHFLERNRDKENPEIEKFLEISRHKSVFYKVLKYYSNHYRTGKAWWIIIERGF